MLIGTLLFATITYGAVVPWAAFLIHWATLALATLTVLRALYRGDVGWPRGWFNYPIAVLAAAALISTSFSIYPCGSIREALRIFSYIAFFYLAAIYLATERALVRFLTIVVVVAAVLAGLLPVVGLLGAVVAFAVADFYSLEIYIMANGLLFWALAGAGVGLAIVAETAPVGFRPPPA